MATPPTLDGLVPEALAPRTFRVFLEDYALPVDIGFHAFEVGHPQRLLVTVEVWIDTRFLPTHDDATTAWDYDFLRCEIGRLAGSRRFNLQESFVREIYALIAARAGVTRLRVAARKPDIYPDCAAVGVEIASF
jgi:dihydroneopterin aldolase